MFITRDENRGIVKFERGVNQKTRYKNAWLSQLQSTLKLPRQLQTSKKYTSFLNKTDITLALIICHDVYKEVDTPY